MMRFFKASSRQMDVVVDATSADDAVRNLWGILPRARTSAVVGYTESDDAADENSDEHSAQNSTSAVVGYTELRQHPFRSWNTIHNVALAFGYLALVLVVALATMLGAAALVEHLIPSRRFDVFRAFHEPIVIGALVFLAILWVLPPYPWVARDAELHKELQRVPDGRGVPA